MSLLEQERAHRLRSIAHCRSRASRASSWKAVTADLGGAFFGLGAHFDKVVFLALASLSVGSGVWILVTGRTWKVPDDKPPTWWKAGFLITVGACVAAMYVYVFSGGVSRF